jgi:thioredoxin reductase
MQRSIPLTLKGLFTAPKGVAIALTLIVEVCPNCDRPTAAREGGQKRSNLLYLPPCLNLARPSGTWALIFFGTTRFEMKLGLSWQPRAKEREYSMVDTVIVGAGPYGLSIAAHLRQLGLSYRIFGRVMDSWSSHMPKGMMLKSDGFASDLHDLNGAFGLKRFCADHKIQYADQGIPVALETFSQYGLEFKSKFVPDLCEDLVTRVSKAPQGFAVEIQSGEVVIAKRVVLAVGITHYPYIPQELRHLGHEFLTHSFEHADLTKFQGRRVIVIGSGSSALDLAALLHEGGVHVRILARNKTLEFHAKGRPDEERSLWQRLRSPKSGLGPGLKSRFYANWPNLFWHLPQDIRLRVVKTLLGPAGGWFIKDRVLNKVPTVLGSIIREARAIDGSVRLRVGTAEGIEQELSTEHLIAATGYRVDIDRLKFLSEEIRERIKTVESTPVLSPDFEASVPGLYFVGLSAANSFGPVMRFAFGSGFAARHLSRVIAKSDARGRAMGAVPDVQVIDNPAPERTA